jgi:hypothetical protein
VQVLRTDLIRGTLRADRTPARLPPHETCTQMQLLTRPRTGHFFSPSAGSERRRQADGHGIRAHGCRESWVKQRRVAAGYAARRRSLARWHDVGTVRFAWLLYVHQVRVDGFKQLPRALRCLPMPVRAPLVLEQRRPCLWRPAVDPPVRLSDHMYDVSVSAVRSNRDRAR